MGFQDNDRPLWSGNNLNDVPSLLPLANVKILSSHTLSVSLSPNILRVPKAYIPISNFNPV